MQYTKTQIESAMVHLRKARNTNAIGLAVSVLIFFVLIPFNRLGFGALIVGAYELFKVIQLTGKLNKLESLLATAVDEPIVASTEEQPTVVEASESTLG